MSIGETGRIVPQLLLADVAAGAQVLASVFGFAPMVGGVGQRMALGDQLLDLVPGQAAGHGVIDHLALSVADVDAALAQAQAHGAVIADVTPGGPLEIPEFWAHGMRYVFLNGPEGARIELCAQLGVAHGDGWGHDHIGIPCHDLAAMRAFWLELGATEVSAVTLDRPDGAVFVSFLRVGTSMLELYSLPEHRAKATPAPVPGRFAALRLEATGLPTTRITAPEGLVVEVAS